MTNICIAHFLRHSKNYPFVSTAVRMFYKLEIHVRTNWKIKRNGEAEMDYI